MAVCPNLLEGFKMWVLLFIHGPDNIGYMSKEEKSSLRLTKFTVFLPLLPTAQIEAINKTKYLQISDDLRTINLVVTTSSQIISKADLPSKFTLQWNFTCGQRTMRREYPVILSNTTKLITSTEGTDDHVSIFRGKLVKVDASGKEFVIYFSLSTPVSTDIIGNHSFSLSDGRGTVLMRTTDLLLKPFNNRTVLPTKGKICRGSSKICDVIILPKRRSAAHFTCRRPSEAPLDFRAITSQKPRGDQDGTHPLVVFVACLLATIIFSVLSVTVIRLKSNNIRRQTVG